MKTIISIIFLFALSGCASLKTVGNNEAYVISPEGEKYTVGLKTDAKVTYKDDNVELEVDNRGREGIAESLIKLYGVKVLSDDD